MAVNSRGISILFTAGTQLIVVKMMEHLTFWEVDGKVFNLYMLMKGRTMHIPN